MVICDNWLMLRQRMFYASMAMHRHIFTGRLCDSSVAVNEVTPITCWSGLGNRASVRVRFYGYV